MRGTPRPDKAGNVRNGSPPKTVLTEGTGQVGIEVPRDRDGTFEPQVSPEDCDCWLPTRLPTCSALLMFE